MATKDGRLEEDTDFYFDPYNKRKPKFALPVLIPQKDLDEKMVRIGEVVEERAKAAIKRKEQAAKSKQTEAALDEELETLAQELATKAKVDLVTCKWEIDFEKKTATLIRLDTGEVVKKAMRLEGWQVEQARQLDLEDAPKKSKKNGKADHDDVEHGAGADGMAG